MITEHGLNFGDMLDELGTVLGVDDAALIQSDRTISWPEMTARSNSLARTLRELGAETGDKACFYMRNRPEYMESLAACFKARLTHVNVNYRYVDEELVYIFDNSDATVALYDTAFAENIARIRTRLPKVKVWVEVGGDTAPDGAHAYETLATSGDGSPLDIARSGEDQMFLYTGGTTGMPKGVIWTHDIWRRANRATIETNFGLFPETVEEHAAAVVEFGRHTRQLPACPLMHGTGLFTALGAMLNGGCVVTMETTDRFDPADLWRNVDRHKVTSMAIVGDAFAKPMLTALEDADPPYDVSSVLAIVSSGVMWSAEVKRGLLSFMPGAAMMDSFGASESVGFGMSVMTAEGETQTAKFEIGPTCKVFAEDGREITPGSDEPGIIARGGAVPLGYYKDEKKSAETFRTIGGTRYAIPGDWCTVASDGTLTLLGRGSNCINSAGEKIYPEEVEEALKAHSSVKDALVVGVPDEKWGQAVTAVVARENGSEIGEDALRDFVKTQLARFKAPKRILFKPDLGRAANGKADYASIRTFALEALGLAG